MFDPFGRKAVKKLQAEVDRVRATNAEHLAHTNELTAAVQRLGRELTAVRAERDGMSFLLGEYRAERDALKEALRRDDESMKALYSDVHSLFTRAYAGLNAPGGGD